ncbi:tRNA (adenine(22)-N(1))-methyltransferase TrmK [Bacillus sp. 165]|uniref:tRNA (adenine(22)-N(1))-methyltransferase n=1 Tax=Bacillus sp. 165 TaxID=1529117 RepID=UPI001ADAAA4D|nr:tRNA (adenine(22)-N(1))-methyltransferase TrmK [Bacillus sp. 165]MBO9129611.1 tRNA (adenine-N(1))-methyltransferase [Bacillus sp. 165]
MNEIKLSKRLEEVAKEIPQGAKLADIGSDHAYLPCYAVLQNKITYAIAGEITEGPLQSAKSKVNQYGLQEKIEVRKGDGLTVISQGEVDAITIAGMGGALIRDILEAGKTKLEGVTRLILQPNIGAHNIREWLIANSWELIKEKILKEDGKIYEILVAEKGNPMMPYEIKRENGLFLGPFLMKEKSEVFKEKWTHELKNLKHIYEQLQNANETEEASVKRKEIENKIRMVEEVLG